MTLFHASKSMLHGRFVTHYNGRIVCRVTRLLKPSTDIPETDRFKLFKLDEGPFYLLSARGSTKPGGLY